MDSNSILIVGANGQLGKALAIKYPGARLVDVADLDITSRSAVDNFDLSGIKYILNVAAYTDVDGAESSDGKLKAWAVNAVAVSNLVRISLKNDIVLVHISTDYVFDGARGNHLETETYSPLGVYGQTKAAGDIAVEVLPKHYIVRTSWVIGDGKNFIRTMLELGSKGIEPKVVSDQIGRLTFTAELVRAIDFLITSSAEYGTYNVSNGGQPSSWAKITREIFKLAQYQLEVFDITTKDYYSGKDGIAPRPLKSSLSLDKLAGLGFKFIDWKEDLSNYIKKELSV